MVEEYNMLLRENALNSWLEDTFSSSNFTIAPLAGDASFRRYFRVHLPHCTRVVMDAPPEKESLHSFINVHQLLKSHAILTPEIHAINLEDGFLLLDDLGDCLLLKRTENSIPQDLYLEALKLIVQMHSVDVNVSRLPHFDPHFMQQEVNLFEEWFLKKYLKIDLTSAESQILKQSQELLINEIDAQPKVIIHRDYHSRNLMVVGNTPNETLAVIDFQDAMIGPITYDLVSLLKDCYIKLPTRVFDYYIDYFHQNEPLVKNWQRETLIRAIDFCGLQRHLKVLGIFCRLYLRDGKLGYLRDLPLTLDYVMTCLARYPEWQLMNNLMQTKVLPIFNSVSV